MKIRVAAIALFAFFLSACGDGSLVAVNPDDTPPASLPSWVLTVTSAQPVQLAPYSIRPLTVRLTRDGTPVSDVDVAFAIQGASGGARLSALRARTSNTGNASIDVIAGGGLASFSVLVETAHTAPLRATISVEAEQVVPGALRVKIAYPEQIEQPIRRASISVHPAGTRCGAVGAVIPTAIEIQHLTDITSSVFFDVLDPADPVTVIAQGHNDNTVVADGCLEGVALQAGAETQLTIELGARPLDVTGTYDLATTYDFADALPGTAGAVVGAIARIFDDLDDPGRYLVELIEVKAGFSFGFLRETAVDLVQGFILRWVPERFLRLFQWVGDAARAVTNLGVESTLVVSRGTGGALVAHESWDTLVFGWTGDCNAAANPGCDQHRIAVRNTHLGRIEADFPVELQHGVLRLGAHTRTMPYARLFHVFILQVVYPYIVPGATSTAEVMRGSIDCAEVALELDLSDGLQDGAMDLGVASPTVQTLEGWCNDVLGVVGLVVDAKLDDLAQGLPSAFDLEGAARIVDTDRNLVPEGFSEGVWEGGLTVDGFLHPVAGSFEGARRTR